MGWQTLAVERVGSTAVVSLNRPEKRNAMSPRMHEEMTELAEQLRDENEVRVLVLTGAGDADQQVVAVLAGEDVAVEAVIERIGAAAASTRSRVASATVAGAPKTRDAIIGESPARVATCSRAGLALSGMIALR